MIKETATASRCRTSLLAESLSRNLRKVANDIAYVSPSTPLSPGDVIATGTPGGVGAKRTPPLWMKPGDIVEVEIAGTGLLASRIVAQGAFARH